MLTSLRTRSRLDARGARDSAAKAVENSKVEATRASDRRVTRASPLYSLSVAGRPHDLAFDRRVHCSPRTRNHVNVSRDCIWLSLHARPIYV